ncbi:MAG: ABC transporter ATP-binding protein [Bacteroidaceae bacterium]|nr:ABC transporter ATP-binding protein [Bacteroidaceae bacterium]
MISIRNIHKSFDQLHVLKGIDLDISKGEIVSILGPSGAGKTTLLQVMGTLLLPDEGQLTIAGTDVTRLSRKALSQFRNQHIGFVFQFHQLLPEFTAHENVLMPALIAGTTRKAAERRAHELLEYLHVAERADHKPAALSGGEKQRVAVARALMNEPDIIFADEPTGSLDSHNRAELHQLFFQLRQDLGQTFVIVTHDDQLAQLTDRSIHLLDGRVATPAGEAAETALDMSGQSDVNTAPAL